MEMCACFEHLGLFLDREIKWNHWKTLFATVGVHLPKCVRRWSKNYWKRWELIKPMVRKTFLCHSFILISSLSLKTYLIRHWKFWLIPSVNWFRCTRQPSHVDFSRHFWTKWFESIRREFSSPLSMLSMFNHVPSVKSILSRWSTKTRIDAQVHRSSRNTRVQADYGLSYMSRIVVASQQGISSDEETEKLIVGERCPRSGIVRPCLFSSYWSSRDTFPRYWLIFLRVQDRLWSTTGWNNYSNRCVRSTHPEKTVLERAIFVPDDQHSGSILGSIVTGALAQFTTNNSWTGLGPSRSDQRVASTMENERSEIVWRIESNWWLGFFCSARSVCA